MIAVGSRRVGIQIGIRWSAAGSDVECFAFPRSGALTQRAASIIVSHVWVLPEFSHRLRYMTIVHGC